MPGLKSRVVSTGTGTAVAFQPVILSLDLTPEQRAVVLRATGQCPAKLERCASELKVILLPGLAFKDASF